MKEDQTTETEEINTKKKKYRLTTFMGNAIENLTYEVIGGVILGIIIISAVCFWGFGLAEYNSDHLKVGRWDALYFSIISFTSLGYGDIVPVGIGKLVASIEVLSGLVFMAIFVGKLASERQSALLLLMYTSESQKRLLEYEEKILNLIDTIDVQLDEHDSQNLFYHSKSGYNFVSSVSKYLLFHADQGALASFGNTPTLKKAYAALAMLQKKELEAIQTSGTPTNAMIYFNRTIEKIDSTAQMMKRHHLKHPKLTAILNEINSTTLLLNKWNDLSPDKKVMKSRTVITENLKSKVKAILPADPYVYELAKTIAPGLNISRHLAEKIINLLLNERQ